MRYILFLVSLFGISSCLIENDMSFPEMEALITAFEVEGQKSVKIDAEKRHVEVILEETADISSVRLKMMEVNEGSELVGSLPEHLDLTEPYTIVLKAYEEFTWTVSAIQPIERYIHVKNQVGEASLDVESKTAFVYVTEYQQLTEIEFLDIKLEPQGSELVSTTGFRNDGNETIEETLPCVLPMTLECVMLRTFRVRYLGEEMDWTVRVQKKKVGLQITSVNPYARRAEVKAGYDGNGDPVLEYRKASDSEWTALGGVVVAAAGLSGVIEGLQPDTDYVVRVANNGNYSSEHEFRTENAAQLYNMNFDEWWQSGKIWYPYAQGADPSVWDSANPGAATFIGSSTTPEETVVVKGKAVKMQSAWAVIAFAAGNVYTGKFGKIAGVGAELDWGVPFTSRPTSLKGYYNYAPKAIDKADAAKLSAGGYDADELLGSMDKCQIQVILTDWDGPFRINTTSGQFVDIENDEHIIAFGRLESDRKTDGYEEFKIDLEYRDKVRKPKYVVISACASYLGDYFTGAVGSTMYIDEFEFVY